MLIANVSVIIFGSPKKYLMSPYFMAIHWEYHHFQTKNQVMFIAVLIIMIILPMDLSTEKPSNPVGESPADQSSYMIDILIL